MLFNLDGSYFELSCFQQRRSVCQNKIAGTSNPLLVDKNELKTTSNILIGIYSTEDLLKTRGRAILDTWYNSVDKKKAEIVFFANATVENMKIVKLPGVSDYDYPPQKKSFRALQHVLRYYSHIEWYLRADDDIVINWDNFEVFLNQLDHEKEYLIGAPGFGKHEEDFIEEGFAFCMGGPGVLMSKGLLDKLRGRINECQNGI